MKNLRLLNVNFSINCDHLNYLSNELRLFQWFGCRLRSFPPSFQPHNLVALIAEDSRIERLWEGTKRMDNLKRVNLGYSINLIETPDFSEAPNLEYLDFKYCTGLVFVHPSITVHKRVKLLDLGGCESLRSLPPEIRMESLEKLKLRVCSNLERFPKIVGKMERLLKLDLSNCYKIENWREMLRQAQLLSSLKKLKLSNCNLGEGDIPTEIGCLSSLEVLNLCGNPFNNCYRSVENKMNAETFLKKHLKLFANSTEGLVNIVMPGSEIPEWFRGHERVESSSMKIPMPLTIRNGGQWMGVAFFCIFINRGGENEIVRELDFEARVCDRNSGEGVNFRIIDHCFHRIGPIRKDHIFLRYLSRARLSTPLESFGQEWDELEFSFAQDWADSVKVKQCGFRMVYQKDLEDIQLREEQQHNNQGSAEFEDNNEDGSIASDSLVNQKHNVSEDDTEAMSQQPKFFKFICCG